MTHRRKLSPLALIAVLLGWGFLGVKWIQDGKPSLDQPKASSEIQPSLDTPGTSSENQPSPEMQQALSELFVGVSYVQSWLRRKPGPNPTWSEKVVGSIDGAGAFG
jgi:hypothetical protein